MSQELIICAAIRFKDQIWRGHRHADAMRAMHDSLSFTMSRKQMIKKHVNKDQGFITSLNRYVDRKEAFIIASNAGQISIGRKELSKELYSEDLY